VSGVVRFWYNVVTNAEIGERAFMAATEAATVINVNTRLHSRTLTIARAAWIGLVLITLAVFFVGLPLSYHKALNVSPSTVAALARLGLPASFAAVFLTALDTASILGFTLIAVLLFWRRSDDWMVMFVGLLLILTGFVYTDPGYNLNVPYWIVGVLVALGETCQAVFFYVFPDGRFVPRWVRWLVLPLIVWRLIMWIGIYLPHLAVINPDSAERYGYVPQDSIDIGLFLLILVLGIVSQVYRYRRVSTLAQRQQAKWLLFGTFVTVAVVGAYVFLVNTLGLLEPSNSSNFVAFATLRLIRQIALMIVPVCIAISITRYRLWNIDLIINRGLVYGTLTVIYVGSVLVLQLVFQAVTGGQQSTIAVALSTAVIAAVFQPMRRGLQRAIDRRFYPMRIDPEQFTRQPLPIPNPGALTNTTLGSYQVLELLGRGGMGEVYKGRHPTLDRTVAIKILPDTLANKAEFRARFEREAKTVASLRHPNIVNVFDFGNVGGTYYMVMEYISGLELNDYLEERGPIPLPEAFPFISDIAGALDYAHEQGLVHRDVKPSNVMLQKVTATGSSTRTLRAILMDFGVAKIINANTGLTQTGAMGTLDYMAPEQIMSAKEVDSRADVYALGVMIYQMLTGELPYKGSNAGQILFAHLQEAVPDPRAVAPTMAEHVALAIMRALAKSPEERFQTAGALSAALMQTDRSKGDID
jgi:Protein kinase domain